MGIFRPGEYDITDRAMEICKFSKGQKLLDVGCGDGEVIEYIENKYGLRTFGIDISKERIAEGLERNPDLRIQEGDGEFLDFPSFTFDAVMMECSLSLIGLQEEAVHEAYCVLKRGGVLIVNDLYLIDPDPNEVLQLQNEISMQKSRPHEEGDCESSRLIPSEYCMEGAFIKESLVEMIEKIGFKVVHWEDRTDDLKTFMAESIMRGDTLSGGKKKKGYFMLIAEKENESGF